MLSFSESWLNRSYTEESLKLSNYQTPFRKDRGPNKSGGGVILYVKDNINVSRRDDFEYNDLEGIWVQIKINGKKILFENLNIPPKSTQDIWGKLETSIEMAIKSKYNACF